MKKDELAQRASKAMNGWVCKLTKAQKKELAKFNIHANKPNSKKNEILRRKKEQRKAKCIRTSLEYKMLRNKVIERANGRCELCGVPTDKLVMHHIKQVTNNPDMILNFSNVLGICGICHEEIHPWLRLKTAQ